MDESLNTISLHAMIDRFRDGQMEALNDLILRTQANLERLARKMLRKFPGIQSREQTHDVLQNAILRLARALQEVKPNSVREFYGLANEMIRRELLDLVRAHRRRPTKEIDGYDPADDSAQTDLDMWAQLQECIEQLPVEMREVFCLTFYHKWSQADIAALLQVSDRQVRRYWKSACSQLKERLDLSKLEA